MLVNDTSCNIWKLNITGLNFGQYNIIFRNVEIFTRKNFKEQTFVKEKYEIFKKFQKLTNYSTDMCWSLPRHYRHLVCVSFWLFFLSVLQCNIFRTLIGDKSFTETWNWQKNCHKSQNCVKIWQHFFIIFK